MKVEANMRLFIILFICLLTTPAYAQLKILSDIRPIYYLIEGVNQGINPHELLFSAATSPHDYQPKPSDIQKVSTADIVFKIGRDFMPQLNKISSSAINIALVDLPNINALKDANDLHIWLSPINAIIITQKVALELSKLDKKNAHKYQYNAEQQIEQLRALNLRLNQQLQAFKNKTFFTYHNAYGYFTQNFGLQNAIAFTKNHEQKISAKRMQELLQIAKAKKVNCVMLEPQFSNKISKNIVRANKNITTQNWDLLGTELELTANSYHTVLKAMTNALTQCLKDSRTTILR